VTPALSGSSRLCCRRLDISRPHSLHFPSGFHPQHFFLLRLIFLWRLSRSSSDVEFILRKRRAVIRHSPCTHTRHLPRWWCTHWDRHSEWCWLSRWGCRTPLILIGTLCRFGSNGRTICPWRNAKVMLNRWNEVVIIPFQAVATGFQRRNIDLALSYGVIRICILWIFSQELCHGCRYFLLLLLWRLRRRLLLVLQRVRVFHLTKFFAESILPSLFRRT